jgi:crooked neck
LNEDPQSVSLWLAYIDAELKHRNINHARNLLNRAVGILPRVDKFWYKFVYMEETLNNIPAVRQLFERWMQWEPDENAWGAYIKLEKRYGETDRGRAIFERMVQVHQTPSNWLKWARFEEENADMENVRDVFSSAMEVFGDGEFIDERIYVAFARYETRLKEYERARTIYKYALDRLPRSKSQSLYQAYTAFEKQFGNKDGLEDVIISKRRLQYEEQVNENPKNYDAWFDYARLEEIADDPERVRDVYERAISQMPPTQEKQHWRRYIYLWINYALYEELDAKDYERARQVYREAIKLIPHKTFTFAKLWLLAAQFEIRQMQLTTARKLLGQALGRCPKSKIFKGYIELEMQLREFDRCRTLYEKFLEYNPTNSYTWISYAGLESLLDDIDRVRAIYEFAITSPQGLDIPEAVWKAYIDFEVEEQEYGHARALYEKLLDRTDHVKVWISYAEFEVGIPEEQDIIEEEQLQVEMVPATSDIAKARGRAVFNRAYQRLKDKELKEEVQNSLLLSYNPNLQRVVLLEAWKQYELTYGDEESLAKVEEMMPKVIKKRRKLEDGSFEEYFDYLFKDGDESNQKMVSLLKKAQEWRARMQNEG